MTKRNLGNHFLKQWREYRGLSLRKMAGLMEAEPGVELTSHANIGRIENFQQPYSQEILEAAAETLGCTVIDILTVDPTTGGYNTPDAKLRSALLSYGIDRDRLELAVGAVKVLLRRHEEQPSPDQGRDQSQSATPHRAKAPSE